MKTSQKNAVAAGFLVGASLLVATLAFAQADTTPPTMPTNLQASAVSSSQIDLSWTASTDNVDVTGYNVFRNGSEVASTSNTTYDDTGLAPGTTYTYTVDAFDAAGNLSTQSASASATTQVASTPSVPTSLTATAVSSTQVNLSWSASTDSNGTIEGYYVYRNGTEIGSTSATSYSDTNLSPSTGYTYTVASYDNEGNVSAQSAGVGVTTPASSNTTAPSIPTGLTATAVSSSEINLSWSASTDSNGTVAGYDVYRNGVEIGSTSSTSFSDTNLSASTSYSYTVAAYDTSGNVSGQSGSVSATTLASGTTTTSSYTVPPTVSISANGSILVHGLTVTSVGTDTFTGTVWGITYTVNYTPNSNNGFEFLLRNGNGASWNSSQIQVGDEVGVQGTITQASPNTIQAQIVRNYSITSPRTPGQNNGNSNQGNNQNNGNGQSVQSLQTLLQQLLGRFQNLQAQFGHDGGR